MTPGLIVIALVLSGLAAPAPRNPAARTPGEARIEAIARYGAGLWQARRDRLLSAVKSFEAAAALDPDATAPLKELVTLYSQLGREPAAIRVARRVLERDPADVDTAHQLARLLHDVGDTAGALVAAKLAAASPNLADRPDQALAVWRDLATLASATGDTKAAAEALRKAIALIRQQRKAVLGAGRFTPREADEALADLYERLGKVYVRGEDFAAAAEAFTAAHAIYADPAKANDPAAAARVDWNLSGVCLAKGDPAAAVTHLTTFLGRRPRAVEPYSRYAEALRQASRDAEVIPQLRAFLRRDPKSDPIRAVLAAELARQPVTRAEADILFAELGKTTSDPDVIRLIVRSHIETGRAGLVLADLDRPYQTIHGPEEGRDAAPATENADAEAKATAAERVRVIVEMLRTEPAWADAVLRTGTTELVAGFHHVTRTWHVLGDLASRHGKLDMAASQYRQAIRARKRDTEAEGYAGLINVLWRQRKLADLVNVCRDGLRAARWTSSAFLNYHLAMALAELGEANDALAAADRAITLAGDSARIDTLTRKVWVLRTLGRNDDAIALARKILDDATTPADQLRARYTLAATYHAAGKAAESEAEYRAILDIDPDHVGACNDLGYHLADQGRELDEAERLTRHAVEVDRANRRKAGDTEPESGTYLDSLAWVLFRRGKLGEARTLLERAVSIPDGALSGEIWDHLGDVYFRLGERPKARAAWQQAVELFTDDPRATREGRLDETRRKLRRVP